MKTGGTDSQATSVVSVPTKRLAEIVLETITALAGAGEIEAACRFAGQACVAMRHADPATARPFDALLHRLTSRLKW
jgi:hypothetical protein